MTKIQNSQIHRNISLNGSVCFGNWFFGFGNNLEFGYWDLDFSTVTGKKSLLAESAGADFDVTMVQPIPLAVVW
jgi:hypothetical protein